MNRVRFAMTFANLLQLAVALTLVNVWVLRARRATPWRGGDAGNMVEEFEFYGLPKWSVGVVGFLKVGLALLLIVGLWVPAVTPPAALGLAFLMAGAVAMHLKVGDPARKAAPAFVVLVLCIAIVLL